MLSEQRGWELQITLDTLTQTSDLNIYCGYRQKSRNRRDPAICAGTKNDGLRDPQQVEFMVVSLEATKFHFQVRAT